MIYAATALIPSVEGVGSPLAPGVGGQPPWAGVGGHPQRAGAHNLKTPRMPKTELARADSRRSFGSNAKPRSVARSGAFRAAK